MSFNRKDVSTEGVPSSSPQVQPDGPVKPGAAAAASAQPVEDIVKEDQKDLELRLFSAEMKEKEAEIKKALDAKAAKAAKAAEKEAEKAKIEAIRRYLDSNMGSILDNALARIKALRMENPKLLENDDDKFWERKAERDAELKAKNDLKEKETKDVRVEGVQIFYPDLIFQANAFTRLEALREQLVACSNILNSAASSNNAYEEMKLGIARVYAALTDMDYVDGIDQLEKAAGVLLERSGSGKDAKSGVGKNKVTPEKNVINIMRLLRVISSHADIPAASAEEAKEAKKAKESHIALFTNNKAKLDKVITYLLTLVSQAVNGQLEITFRHKNHLSSLKKLKNDFKKRKEHEFDLKKWQAEERKLSDVSPVASLCVQYYICLERINSLQIERGREEKTVELEIKYYEDKKQKLRAQLQGLGEDSKVEKFPDFGNFGKAKDYIGNPPENIAKQICRVAFSSEKDFSHQTPEELQKSAPEESSKQFFAYHVLRNVLVLECRKNTLEEKLTESFTSPEQKRVETVCNKADQIIREIGEYFDKRSADQKGGGLSQNAMTTVQWDRFLGELENDFLPIEAAHLKHCVTVLKQQSDAMMKDKKDSYMTTVVMSDLSNCITDLSTRTVAKLLHRRHYAALVELRKKRNELVHSLDMKAIDVNEWLKKYFEDNIAEYKKLSDAVMGNLEKIVLTEEGSSDKVIDTAKTKVKQNDSAADTEEHDSKEMVQETAVAMARNAVCIINELYTEMKTFAGSDNPTTIYSKIKAGMGNIPARPSLFGSQDKGGADIAIYRIDGWLQALGETLGGLRSVPKTPQLLQLTENLSKLSKIEMLNEAGILCRRYRNKRTHRLYFDSVDALKIIKLIAEEKERKSIVEQCEEIIKAMEPKAAGAANRTTQPRG